MSKLNIKKLTSQIRENQTLDKSETVSEKIIDVPVAPIIPTVETPGLAEKVDQREVEQKPVVQETTKTEIKTEVVVAQPEKKREVNSDAQFDLQDVINWKRPETTGKKKLVELHKEYDTFFAKVKATTGVSTVKFVNFLVRDFLIKNPDFVRSINEESGKSPQLE